ncbi:MAG: thiosulfate oxidation carrier protein SoxY [Burkholderiales bacterium]
MTGFSRRAALKGVGAGGLLAAAMAAGLLRPSDALADWNKSAFEAKTVGDALKSLRVASPTETRDIAIKAPDIAENGAVVPIEIQSNVPGTRSIAVLIDKNPFPYVGSFDVSQGALPFVALRAKMGESSNVRVVVAAADGKFYTAVKEVKVTIGGCGG